MMRFQNASSRLFVLREEPLRCVEVEVRGGANTKTAERAAAP